MPTGLWTRKCWENGVCKCNIATASASPTILEPVQGIGDLDGQRRAGGSKTGGSTTPLVDAKVGFFEEFTLNEKVIPPMKHPPHQAATGKPREDE